VLLAFYDYPAQHWIHLRTSPIESTFATVRLRQRVTKGPGSRAAGVAMAFKLIESAQARWRAVNAPHLVALVRAGARFEKGKIVERLDESGGDQQVERHADPPVLTIPRFRARRAFPGKTFRRRSNRPAPTDLSTPNNSRIVWGLMLRAGQSQRLTPLLARTSYLLVFRPRKISRLGEEENPNWGVTLADLKVCAAPSPFRQPDVAVVV
jgi:hypothetical protein